MKNLLLFTLLVMGCNSILMERESIIKEKKLNQNTDYFSGKYRYLIKAKESDAVLYSSNEYNVGDTLKFK